MRFRQFILLAMTCMLSGTAGAQSVRETIRLDDGWKFAFGNASDPPCKLSVKISPPTPNIEFSVKYRLVRSLPDALYHELSMELFSEKLDSCHSMSYKVGLAHETAFSGTRVPNRVPTRKYQFFKTASRRF